MWPDLPVPPVQLVRPVRKVRRVIPVRRVRSEPSVRRGWLVLQVRLVPPAPQAHPERRDFRA